MNLGIFLKDILPESQSPSLEYKTPFTLPNARAALSPNSFLTNAFISSIFLNVFTGTSGNIDFNDFIAFLVKLEIFVGAAALLDVVGLVFGS